MSYSSQSGQGAVSNILAVAGFIILIAIIVWGAYHFLELASSGLSSLFGKKDAITVTLSKSSVASGESFDASWSYKPDGAGVYTMLYPCAEGLQLRSVIGNGIVTSIPCGAAFPLGNEAAKTARIIPSITGTNTQNVTLTVIFNPVVDTTSTSTSASPRPQGSAKVSITPATGTTPATTGTQTPGTTGTNTGTPKPSTTPSTPKPVVTGTPDLQVRILAIGVIDAYTGAFVARAPISPEEVVAVKFDVANNGTGSSGAWYFNVEVPTTPAAPYISPRQASLTPGSHIENTLQFNHMMMGGGVFTVTVDQSNTVTELSEKNNTAAIWISGPTSYYPYAY